MSLAKRITINITKICQTKICYLNLYPYLIPDPNNVFFVRANGDSMTGAGIFDQDLLIVDRSKKKPNGKVVIASLNGEFTLKRLVQTRECFEL